MAEPIIRVEDLVKRYRGAEKNAVDGISLEVAPGEFFALLGPNGAGKTTTISILTTTLSPTSGSVAIGGREVREDPAAVRRDLGIIFQKPSLDLNLTAEENVRFHAILYSLYPFRPTYRTMPRAYRTQVEELASVLGMEGEMFGAVKTFSGGMKRKLEIIRSLVHRPKVLFLDEPTTGLDPQSRRALWDYLKGVRERGETTIFLTTHYLEEAEEADTICIMGDGKVVARGTPDEVKAELVEEYLLLDAEDRDVLALELRALEVPYTDSSPMRVELDGRTAQEIIKKIETPLTTLRTYSPTLEEAYLAVVGRE